MTKRAEIVIGANYGDEGKGLVTDFRAAQLGGTGVVVVRHNGGAQAGHTVTTPEGTRHVFHHFGSGSFAGADTFLSRYFACNPILFARELAELEAKGAKPDVYVDARAQISTPYDMMINQIIEEARGGARHGSCGVGFGETVERSEHGAFGLSMAELADADVLRATLREIQHVWVPQRLRQLGLRALPDVWAARLTSDDIFEKYIESVAFFRAHTIMTGPDFLARREAIVFEGAQGLLLDQARGAFPHVTRSYTGIRNAVTLAIEAGVDTLGITYATRAYATRHGAGPFAHELPEKPYEAIQDPTNVPNEYQGALRFGWLDLDALARAITDDLSDAPATLRTEVTLAVTCLDQVPEQHTYVRDGQVVRESREAFLTQAAQRTGAARMLGSFGPSRKTLADTAVHLYDIAPWRLETAKSYWSSSPSGLT